MDSLRYHLLQAVNEQRYFFLSGSIATVVVVGVFAGLLYLMSHRAITHVALKISPTVSVSLVDFTPNIQKRNDSTSKNKRTTKSVKPVTRLNQRDESIESLFSTVKSNKIERISKSSKKQPSKPLVSKSELTRIQKKSQRAEVSKKVALAPKAIEEKKQKVSTTENASSAEKVDKYLATIQATIYQNFFPPTNSSGMVSKIRVKISSFGTLLSFIVLAYSGDELFDKEVDAVAKRLKSVTFVKSPNHKPYTIDVYLVSKE